MTTIVDREAALAKLNTFLDLLTKDRDDFDNGRDRSSLDDIYKYIDTVGAIALAVDVNQFHRIRVDDTGRWDTARIAVLRIIGQLEHADDIAKILRKPPPIEESDYDTSAEPF